MENYASPNLGEDPDFNYPPSPFFLFFSSSSKVLLDLELYFLRSSIVRL
jgi:hypothetical protein